MPTSTAAITPSTAATGHGNPGPSTGKGFVVVVDPLAIIRAMKKAATPARDIWASEICPT